MTDFSKAAGDERIPAASLDETSFTERQSVKLLLPFRSRIMGMEEYTRHQQGIIKRYYEHKDSINLQKLAELVGELYLSEGKKLEKVWKSVESAMTKLEVPPSRIQHVMAQKKPELVAGLVKELQGK